MKKRYSNFELLKIFLMLFIIAGHVIMYSEKSSLMGSFDYYTTNIIRSFCMVAVNVFVLLSGYFGIKLKAEKLIKLDLRIVFYTWIIFAFAVALNIHEVHLLKDILLLLPVTTKQYWFITIYFVLCIFSPYINKFLNCLSKKELQNFLIVGFILFYVISTFGFLINANQIVNDAGYGIINFIYLYSLGFYLKNYYEDRFNSKHYFLMYLAVSILLFISNDVVSKCLGFYFNSFISYNTVYVLLGSIFLFMTFMNIKMNDVGLVNALASKCLVVYIIHMNPTVSSYLFKTIFNVNKLTGINLIIGIFVIPIIVYFVAYCIDSLVDLFMKPTENYVATKVITLCKKHCSKTQKNS